MRNPACTRCGTFVSGLLIAVGMFLVLAFPPLYTFIAHKEFQLSPKSQSFKHWRKTPIPVTLDFYLFNWTNPERLGKERPAFVEMGPYKFYESREKVNLTWNDNGTLTYRQRRSWHFAADQSNGSLDDLVTTINPVTLTAANAMRHEHFVAKTGLHFAFVFTTQKIWVRQTVGDMLFNGYSDQLMSLAHKFLPSGLTVSSPFEKFAWFYQKNNSYSIDGVFNMDTGANNISDLGRIRNWNWRNHSGFYPGKCGVIEGFTGDMFPPGILQRGSQFNIFSHDLCQRMPFEYAKERSVRGINGYEFVAKLDRESKDCCNGDCLPGGFLNLTLCRFGAPVFVSFPHFYDSNAIYLSLVDGLSPDPERHGFTFAIEPTFGIPLDVKARVQLNLFMHPIPHISMYKSVPRIMMPVLWVDQRTTLTEPLAKEVRLVLLLPTIALVTGIVASLMGILLAMALLVLQAYRAPLKSAETLVTISH